MTTRVRIGHNSGAGFVEDEALSLSDRGYDFQHRATLAILTRLRGFASVSFKDMNGNSVTLEDFRRRGRDGGIDLVIEVEASTVAATKAIRTRVRNIVLALQVD